MLPPDDEIWYTSLTNDTLTLYKYDGVLISNTYINGKGVYKFNAPVTTILRDQFQDITLEESSLYTSLILPKTISSLQTGALGPLKNATCVVLPSLLASIESDIIWRVGEQTNQSVHIFFLNKIAPLYTSTSLWNLSAPKGTIFHYPQKGDYASFIDAIDYNISQITTTEWLHEWVPTTYYLK